jgi:hypothetical protein
MRVEFLGGPRDGDYTYQSYEPPPACFLPTAQNLKTFLRRPVTEVVTFEFAEYHVYELKKTNNKNNYKYDYIGVKHGGGKS